MESSHARLGTTVTTVLGLDDEGVLPRGVSVAMDSLATGFDFRFGSDLVSTDAIDVLRHARVRR